MALVVSNRNTGYFQSYILQRIENNKNFLACITGQTGSGKSWSALRLAETLDPNFTIDNVCFTAKQFMNLINGNVKQLQKGSNILFDEIQVTMGHLDYQTLQAKLLNYILQTFRHRNFVLWVTTPHYNFINASARKLFHSRMETISINKNTKKVTLKPFLLQINQDTGDVYRKYLRLWHKDYGIVPLKTLKVGMPSKELLEAYEQKKTEFTQQLNESIAKDLERLEDKKEDRKELTEKQREVVMLLKEGLSIPEIAERMGKVERTIYEHMSLIEKKGIRLTAIKEASKVLRYEVLGFEGY